MAAALWKLLYLGKHLPQDFSFDAACQIVTFISGFIIAEDIRSVFPVSLFPGKMVEAGIPDGGDHIRIKGRQVLRHQVAGQQLFKHGLDDVFRFIE